MLLVGAYLIDVLFDLMPGSGQLYDFFPFYDGEQGWDGKMTLQNYVYGYCQHLFLIMIFHAVYVHTGRKYWEFLMWLEVIDMGMYAACYNGTLFTLFGHGIDFNYFKFVAVVYLTHREYAERS